MTDTRKPIIQFKDLTFGYDNMNPVLSQVNLAIGQGENLAIVGANGAGKSTLMKLLMGLLKPSKGNIQVDGLDVVHKNLKTIRKTVGYTFQEPDNQLFMPSVYEDVAFGARQEGKGEAAVEAIVNSALESVDACHLKNKASYKMSGGEKRIVTIATVLAASPKVLVMDEPSVGLDPKSRRQLINLLAGRQETKIIATHDMDMALDLCDRIVVLNGGTIQGDGDPMTIFNDRKLLEDNHLEQPLRLQGCPRCGR